MFILEADTFVRPIRLIPPIFFTAQHSAKVCKSYPRAHARSEVILALQIRSMVIEGFCTSFVIVGFGNLRGQVSFLGISAELLSLGTYSFVFAEIANYMMSKSVGQRALAMWALTIIHQIQVEQEKTFSAGQGEEDFRPTSNQCLRLMTPLS